MSEGNRSKSRGDKLDTIEKEVRRLFMNNPRQIPQSAMYKLREKYGDEDILDQIQDAFIERSKEIKKKAKKFARMIMDRYGNQNYPLHILLKKAVKYKVKYGLSDGEFEEFRRIYEQQITGQADKGQHVDLVVPYTSMSQALGQPMVDLQDGIKTKNSEDMRVLQDVLKLYAETKPLHAQVVLQSMVYKDCAYEALTGQFVKERMNPYCHVHPVLAALFIPRIKLLESHILRANIAYIVKQRYLKQPIQTQNDYELFYDLVSDPTDVVCSGDSAIKDLYVRAQLQQAIWTNVVSLRNGRYYDCSNTNFQIAVESCRRNTHENPDNLYVNDEGAILQRILGSFSLRPTICATTPLYNIFSNGPMKTNNILPKVASLPLITLRLPPVSTLNQDNRVINLQESLQQYQWYIEDGNVIPKNQQVIYSRGCIFFYVPRRAHTLNITRLTKPYRFHRLPATVAGFERLNDREVRFEDTFSIRDSSYCLRSVVCLEVNPELAQDNGPKIVTGQSAIIVKRGGADDNDMVDRYYWYNPRDANIGHFKEGATAKEDYVVNGPVTTLNSNLESEDFNQRACRRGTIFVYEEGREGKAFDRITW